MIGRQENQDKILLLVEDNPDDVQLTLRSLKKNNILKRINEAIKHLGLYWLLWNEAPPRPKE